MPEGDTVYLAAKRLDAALAGRTIATSDFRLPSLATADVSGRIVHGVHPYGKHLMFRFDDQRTLHTHFRMDGTWHLYRSGDRWRGGPDHQVRIVLTADDVVVVGYRLHDVALISTARESELIGHLGPDILADDWSLEPALRRLRDRARVGPVSGQVSSPVSSPVSIAAALTDQRIVAGIGNIYRCESLFLTGLHPWTNLADVPDDRLAAVLASAHELMMRNRDRASQSTTGDERRAHFVYGRAGRACLRCGTGIQVRRIDGANPGAGADNEQRVTWCPTCQPEK